MAIFSRRALQDLIDNSSSFLEAKQVRRKVNILNQEQEATIPTEWELALLYAFTRLGQALHEEDLGGKARPDIRFTPTSARNSIAIDIAVVSDKYLHKENPYDALMEELTRRLRKSFPQGIPGNFHLEVRAVSLNVFRGSGPTKLRIPHQHQFKSAVFNKDFSAFLARIIASPLVRQVFSVKNYDVDIGITFEPSRYGLSGSHASYTTAHSKTSNPVANTLHAKAKQLKSCGFPGPYGIVLCDGGCELLTRKHTDWTSFHIDDVVRNFLRRNQSISFVLTVIVGQDNSGRIGPRHLRIEYRLYPNQNFSTLDPLIQQSISRVPEFLPHPVKTALNANSHLAWLRETGQRNQSDSFYGGFTMSGRALKISLRTIQELLAGRIDSATFNQAHGFDRGNPFLKNLEEGCLIAKAEVQRSEIQEDDDWIVFTFGNPDPAVSAFRTPK
jgi:hypothetical protein